MGEPKLYERYDRHEAITLFGQEGKAQVLCDGQWVIFPDVVLCFAEVGDPPRSSHFRSGGEFCWVAAPDDGASRFGACAEARPAPAISAAAATEIR